MFYENYTEQELRREYHDLRWVEHRMNVSDIEWHIRDEEVNYRICLCEGKTEEELLRKLHKKIVKNRAKKEGIQAKIENIVDILVVDEQNIDHLSNFIDDLNDANTLLLACMSLKVQLMKKSIENTQEK